ncbi:MAG TPA: AbrB/MazE/SpoVT family DNA-binding domain-containing protein [Terriglobia bacterium]|nr:AbrB/MazE/SpoVT family DNA-binding domain-containing protein [Terriglobia bacterium]
MNITRLSSKGQVVLPKAIREAHGWQPGTRLAVQEVPGGVLLRPAKPFPPTTFAQVEGSLKSRGRPKTLEEMDEGIRKAIRERHARGRY